MTIAIPVMDGSNHLLHWIRSYSDYRIELFDRISIDMMWHDMRLKDKTLLEVNRQRKLIAHHKKY